MFVTLLPDLRIYLNVQIKKKNQFKSVSMIKGRQLPLLSYVKNGVGCFTWHEFNRFFKINNVSNGMVYVWFFVFGFVSLSICILTQRTGSRQPCLDLRDNFMIFGHGSTGNTVYI